MLFSPIIISKTVILKIVVNIARMAKTVVGISIDNELLAKLDQKRGLIPRSRYIEKVLTDFLV